MKAETLQESSEVWAPPRPRQEVRTNTNGIMKMFQEADASVTKLEEYMNEAAERIEQLQSDDSTRPSQVASGSTCLVFVGLRADMQKLGQNVEELRAQL